jgi:hypothetical protein
MSYQTCPDWPELMEIAPDLQFKHLTVRDAQLPAEALMKIPDINLDEVEICADVDRHVFFKRHTDPRRRRAPGCTGSTSRSGRCRPGRVG